MIKKKKLLNETNCLHIRVASYIGVMQMTYKLSVFLRITQNESIWMTKQNKQLRLYEF